MSGKLTVLVRQDILPELSTVKDRFASERLGTPIHLALLRQKIKCWKKRNVA